MNVLVAVGTSIALGLLTTKYSDYAYWKGWAPAAFRIGGAALIGVYALFGLVGYGIFALAGNGGGNGAAALYGGAGYALLRVQVGRVGPDAERDAQSRNALSFVREWILEFLEKRAKIGVTRWTNALPDAELSSTALSLFHRNFDESTPLGEKQLKKVQSAASNLRGSDPAVVDDARGRLRGNCIQQIERDRLTKGEV